jgi:hypothetical protein
MRKYKKRKKIKIGKQKSIVNQQGLGAKTWSPSGCRNHKSDGNMLIGNP